MSVYTDVYTWMHTCVCVWYIYTYMNAYIPTLVTSRDILILCCLSVNLRLNVNLSASLISLVFGNLVRIWYLLIARVCVMYVCIYVCVYTYIHVRLNVNLSASLISSGYRQLGENLVLSHRYVCMYVCVLMCVCVCMCTCLCVSCTHTWTHTVWPFP